MAAEAEPQTDEPETTTAETSDASETSDTAETAEAAEAAEGESRRGSIPAAAVVVAEAGAAVGVAPMTSRAPPRAVTTTPPQPSTATAGDDETPNQPVAEDESESESEGDGEGDGQRRRRRRRRRKGEEAVSAPDDPTEVVVRVREPRRQQQQKPSNEVTGIEGSTRMEAKRQRRRDGREAGRRRAPILSEAEFLARRESVVRKMIVRQREDLAQIAVLEDDILVEHYVDRDSATSLIGNVYLGRVQNVLPSMEAAFIDIGRGRNAVLYAGEVDCAWTRSTATVPASGVRILPGNDGRTGAVARPPLRAPRAILGRCPGRSESASASTPATSSRPAIRWRPGDEIPETMDAFDRVIGLSGCTSSTSTTARSRSAAASIGTPTSAAAAWD